MAKGINNCTLPRSGTSSFCNRACGSCGWNSDVIKARNAQIAASGLTMGPDGLRRLIIQKEDVTDG
jgi:hypothetical protein